MKIFYFPKCLFIFFCLLWLNLNSCDAQPHDFRRKLNNHIEKFNLTYKFPKYFEEVFPDTLFTAARLNGDGKQLIYANLYEIASKKYDINVCYTYQDIVASAQYEKDHQNIAHLLPDPNKNYIKLIDGFTDTLRYSLYRYPVNTVSKVWNATEVILCRTNNSLFYQKPLFQGKYDMCKVLIIHKENVADIFLYYWYNEKSASMVDKVISETKGMIRFN